MQIVIDISKEDYETIKQHTGSYSYGHAIANGIVFPENPTNGDVLKRLLYGKAIITEFIHDVNISVNNNVIGQFDMEWWNSPYKRGETE